MKRAKGKSEGAADPVGRHHGHVHGTKAGKGEPHLSLEDEGVITMFSSSYGKCNKAFMTLFTIMQVKSQFLSKRFLLQ